MKGWDTPGTLISLSTSRAEGRRDSDLDSGTVRVLAPHTVWNVSCETHFTDGEIEAQMVKQHIPTGRAGVPTPAG